LIAYLSACQIVSWRDLFRHAEIVVRDTPNASAKVEALVFGGHSSINFIAVKQ